jgi:hypothetical protein
MAMSFLYFSRAVYQQIQHVSSCLCSTRPIPDIPGNHYINLRILDERYIIPEAQTQEAFVLNALSIPLKNKGQCHNSNIYYIDCPYLKVTVKDMKTSKL